MADWLSSMTQTFEYYIVDPNTWKDSKKINNVRSCTITWDDNSETLGSATMDVDEQIGENYVRAYLVVIQNGLRERFPLGTFLVQTPSMSFDGRVESMSLDAYTPLIELKEKYPNLGYSVPIDSNIMSLVTKLANEHARAPVVAATDNTQLSYNFVANIGDTWMSFLTDLMAIAKYRFYLDEIGRILFAPKQEISSLQPVWTYNDDNSSILHPDININRDLYGIPNAVEVIYSNGVHNIQVKIVNDDPNSPTSTVNRGREIMYRDSNPSIVGYPSYKMIEEYAKQLLKSLSSLEYRVTYTHGYCPVRVGDAVRLNYSRAGINNVIAKVTRQTIKCVAGCPVSETAVFTNKLWG